MIYDGCLLFSVLRTGHSALGSRVKAQLMPASTVLMGGLTGSTYDCLGQFRDSENNGPKLMITCGKVQGQVFVSLSLSVCMGGRGGGGSALGVCVCH